MGHAVFEIVLDCADPERLAMFYAELLDAPVIRASTDWAVVAAEPITLAFQRVPEPRQVKNRMHADFVADDLEHAVARAVRLGARRLTEAISEAPGRFSVLADPEGNEFCFVTGYPDERP